jgi:beta-glucosidase
VRRNLRVKFRLGLFAAARPYEGRLELIGSAAHRSLAREAVRKSLVLLKNDGVLPIRPSARVLVTGPAAQSISMQSGGWSITWQGAETTNADFPGGESIYAGIKSAIEAGGGTLAGEAGDSAAPLLGNGRPDVAIVVFGESPYAEYAGDLKYAVYNPGNGLEIVRNLRRQGIPVVSVFLSGRPLQVNPEINASNAFVAAWLPGSEGGGVADLLIGDAAGKPRADFSGRLSYTWPVAAGLDRRGAKVPGTALFRPGYGLSYAHGGKVPRLPED